MQDWAAWGDSWGSSRGPLHEVEETGGGYVAVRPARRIPQPAPWRPREDEEALLLLGLI